MKCPIDNTELVMTDRQGIEIDYCPKCRGVWLDRGELDKIIQRSNELSGSHTSAYRGEEKYHYHEDEEDRSEDRKEYRKKKKHGGFLGDLMDFGGD